MSKQNASESEEKPKLRGVLHQYGFFLSIPFGIWLMTFVEGQTETIVTLVYCLGLSSLLGNQKYVKESALTRTMLLAYLKDRG